MLNPEPKPKWYYGVGTVLTALVTLGPFAFPLLWKSPRFNFFWKVFLTVFVTAATFWMMKASADVVALLMKQIQEIKDAGLI